MLVYIFFPIKINIVSHDCIQKEIICVNSFNMNVMWQALDKRIYLLRNSDVIYERPGTRAKTEKKKENAGQCHNSQQLTIELNHIEIYWAT